MFEYYSRVLNVVLSMVLFVAVLERCIFPINRDIL